MLLTAELIFTIFMLAAEKHRATFLAPIGIGLALFVAEMVGVLYTGGKYDADRHAKRRTNSLLEQAPSTLLARSPHVSSHTSFLAGIGCIGWVQVLVLCSQ